MNIKFKEELLRLQFGRYQNTNMISLQLYTTGDYPEPYMTASFNPDLGSVETVFDTLPRKAPMKSNLMAVKNWSENEGIEKALLDNNIIAEYVGTIPTGHVAGNVFTINKEFLGENNRQDLDILSH
jgi:hypothetical protein